MKADIHPTYVDTTVSCTCGNTFTTRSTAPNGVLHADVCSNCHPFYTGKQKILDTGGRVARFEKRFVGLFEFHPIVLRRRRAFVDVVAGHQHERTDPFFDGRKNAASVGVVAVPDVTEPRGVDVTAGN